MKNPKDGCFDLPTKPGLGLTLNREKCAQHPRTGGRLALYSKGWEKRQDAANYADDNRPNKHQKTEKR